jgi:hypothetical protein
MSPLKAITAGLVGGVAGAWAMNGFQRMAERARGGREVTGAAPGALRHGRGPQPAQAERDASDDATARAVSTVVEPVIDRRLRLEERQRLGALAHLAFGAASGALYALTAESWPRATVLAGVPFGVAVWALADEGVVPLLGLSRGPRTQPPSVLAYGLASHFVYGLTTETTRKLVLRTFGE